MMNRMFKKIAATAMTTVCLLGSSLSAFAAEDPITTAGGTGNVEGYIRTDVVKVEVSTIPQNGLDFILDPQELISQSIASEKAKTAYATDGLFPESKTVYFHNTIVAEVEEKGIAAVDTETYSDESNPFYIINLNKNTVNVGAQVKITDLDLTKVNMKESSTWGTSTGADLYMAMKITPAGGSAVTVPISSNGIGYAYSQIATNTTGDSGNLQVEYTTEKGYYYGIKDGSTYKNTAITLTGAANGAGNWSGLTEITPKVDVTWDLKVAGSATVTMTSAGVVTVAGLTKDANFVSIGMYDSYGLALPNMTADIPSANWNVTNWTAENGGTFSVTLSDAYINYWKTESKAKVYAVITLSDGTTAVSAPVQLQ